MKYTNEEMKDYLLKHITQLYDIIKVHEKITSYFTTIVSGMQYKLHCKSKHFRCFMQCEPFCIQYVRKSKT